MVKKQAMLVEWHFPQDRSPLPEEQR